jgi:hypothetical protein
LPSNLLCAHKAAEVDHFLLNSDTEFICTFLRGVFTHVTLVTKSPIAKEIGLERISGVFRVFTLKFEIKDPSFSMALALMILKLGDLDELLVPAFVAPTLDFSKMILPPTCDLLTAAKMVLPKTADLGHGIDKSAYGEYSLATIWKVLRVAEHFGALWR